MGRPVSKTLTTRQEAFAKAYVACLVGAEAARRAGYSPKSAAAQASILLGYPKVRARIDALLKQKGRMTPDEILARLEEQATASIADFLDDGEGLTIDPAKVRAKGHLVRELWFTQEGPRLKLHDGQKALELLGKASALFAERTVFEDLDGLEIVDDDEEAGHPASSASRSTGGG